MKYMGGKKILGKHIALIITNYTKYMEFITYLEPFCGVLGVLVHMTQHFQNCYAYDLHPDLIEM